MYNTIPRKDDDRAAAASSNSIIIIFYVNRRRVVGRDGPLRIIRAVARGDVQNVIYLISVSSVCVCTIYFYTIGKRFDVGMSSRYLTEIHMCTRITTG